LLGQFLDKFHDVGVIKMQFLIGVGKLIADIPDSVQQSLVLRAYIT